MGTNGKLYIVFWIIVTMRKGLLFAGFFVLALLVNNVLAFDYSYSSTSVVFTVGAGEVRDPFDGHITHLEIEDKGYTWLYLIWENPLGDDFSHNLVYLDGNLIEETSGEFLNITGLDEDTRYRVEIFSVGVDEESGAGVSVYGRTLGVDEDDDETVRKSGGKRTGVFNDEIPNFFVEDDGGVEVLNGTIYLYEKAFAQEESFNWIYLIWGILGFLILFLIVLILIVLNKD